MLATSNTMDKLENNHAASRCAAETTPSAWTGSNGPSVLGLLRRISAFLEERFSYRRCAQVVIVAVWYLLIPPMAGQSGVNTRTSLSSWNRAGTYDSQSECLAAKANFTTMLSKSGTAGAMRTVGMLAIQRSNCVAADDYRLQRSGSATQ